jgi:hypothetical protein
MSDPKIDIGVQGLSAETVDIAAMAEEFGFDGVFTSDVDTDPFLPLPLVAEHTARPEYPDAPTVDAEVDVVSSPHRFRVS